MAVLAGLVFPARLTADESQGPPSGPEVILRWDPFEHSALRIAPTQMKVGYVYNHFSQRLHCRVWSYLQADRQFGDAFGPGSVQEVTRFDLVSPKVERVAQLSQEDKGLWHEIFVEKLDHGMTFLMLDANNRWTLRHTASFPAIYDLETGMRWERHHVLYIPVVHVCGDVWGYAEGRYFPRN